MQAIDYTTAHIHLSEIIDKVNESHTPVLITRQAGEPVVMISLADYRAMEETAHLSSHRKLT